MKLIFFGRFGTHGLLAVFLGGYSANSSPKMIFSIGLIFFPRSPGGGVGSERVVGRGGADEIRDEGVCSGGLWRGLRGGDETDFILGNLTGSGHEIVHFALFRASQ
jgi:hypothetical protein